MLNKYDFTNKDDVIDQPSILKITSDQVQIIHASGTNTEDIPEEGLVIQIGNIDSFIPPTPDPIDPDDPEPTPTPDPDPDPDPDPTPTPSGEEASRSISYVSDGEQGKITLNLINQTGYDVYLNGFFGIRIKPNSGTDAWGSDNHLTNGAITIHSDLNTPSDVSDGWPHYYTNPHHIANGQSKSFAITEFVSYDGNGTTVTRNATPINTYANNNWHFVSSNNAGWIATNGIGGIGAFDIGCATQEETNKKNNRFLFNISPVKESDSLILTGKTYNLIINKAHVDKWGDQIIK